MNKKLYFGAAIMGVIVTTAIVAGATYASEGTTWRGQGFMGMHGGEKNLSAREAMETGDYSTWLETLPENSPARAITEENFNKMVEAHNLMQSGDIEGAKAIKDELRDELGPMPGLIGPERRGERGEKEGGHFRGIRKGGNEAVQTAIENNDYEAWLEAMPENCPMHDNATEEDFNKMVEMHSLMAAGDFEGAREIQKELGFGPGKGRFQKQSNE